MRYIDIQHASPKVQAKVYGAYWAGHYRGWDFPALLAEVAAKAEALKASDIRPAAKARRLEVLRREYRDLKAQQVAAAKFAIQAKG